MPFHTFCSAKFSTCIAVRLLKFSVLHGKGESKYRPVATNFQCLKNCCPHSLALVGVRLLHLLRKPCCHSKAPLGLSLLRNRGLVGECLPQTLLMRLAPLKNPSKYFFGFFKNSSALHPVFLLLVRGHHAQPKEVLPCENDITRRTAAG